MLRETFTENGRVRIDLKSKREQNAPSFSFVSRLPVQDRSFYYIVIPTNGDRFHFSVSPAEIRRLSMPRSGMWIRKFP